MAMTASVKDELSRLSITKPCCRKAEVSALLRFAGGLHIAAGKIVIEVELDTSQSAVDFAKISLTSMDMIQIWRFFHPVDCVRVHGM